MRNLRQLFLPAGLTLALTLPAVAQIEDFRIDMLDGADPGFVAVPPNLFIADIHVGVASDDTWIASGIRGDAMGGALLRYQSNGSLLVPGNANRHVTFVSRPQPRNGDARFNDVGVATAGGWCPPSPEVIATGAVVSAGWFRTPPANQDSPSVDGWVMRVVLDLSSTAFTREQCNLYDPDFPPADAFPLLMVNCGGGTGVATLDYPAVVTLKWGVYGVPWGVLGEFFEEQGGDAPELPGFAAMIGSDGFRRIARITGNLEINGVDLFAFHMDDPAAFSATTINGSGIDTQLFLFNENGRAIVFNDNAAGQNLQSLLTPQFAQSPGTYYLAVSRYDRDPLNPSNVPIWTDTPRDGERPPDGQGANNPILASWSGATGAGGNYAIYLTGATTLCTGDVSGNGLIDLADLTTQLSNFGAANGARWNQGNLDGDGDVDLNDLTELLSRYGAACQ